MTTVDYLKNRMTGEVRRFDRGELYGQLRYASYLAKEEWVPVELAPRPDGLMPRIERLEKLVEKLMADRGSDDLVKRTSDAIRRHGRIEGKTADSLARYLIAEDLVKP